MYRKRDIRISLASTTISIAPTLQAGRRMSSHLQGGKEFQSAQLRSTVSPALTFGWNGLDWLEWCSMCHMYLSCFLLITLYLHTIDVHVPWILLKSDMPQQTPDAQKRKAPYVGPPSVARCSSRQLRFIQLSPQIIR